MNKTTFLKMLKMSKMVGLKYFAVIISMPDGSYELIVNHMSSVDNKMKYYDDTYDFNMVHKHCKDIKIIDISASYDMEDIETVYESYVGGKSES